VLKGRKAQLKTSSMEEKELFGKLWAQYAETNPSVQRIHDLFATHGEKVVDDHVAFRTFDDPRIGMDVLARPFLGLGYVPRGTYQFQEKKLRARHYEKPGEPGAPSGG
jgi:hypothetical protein